MPNIAVLLKSEISRLAKKDIRKEVAPLRKASANHRREIAQLKRMIASLDRATKELAKHRTPGTRASVDQERPIRFVAKGLVSLRKRLGLSADQMARLLGVSMQSVYNWERKKATPRKEQVAAIVALRGIGKKEAQQRLEVSGQKRSPKRIVRRPSKKRAVKRSAARPKQIRRKAVRRAK